jgi:hypothetical protein
MDVAYVYVVPVHFFYGRANDVAVDVVAVVNEGFIQPRYRIKVDVGHKRVDQA